MIEQYCLFSDAERKGIKLYIEHDTSVDEWICKNHYLHSTPAGAIIRMCFKDQTQRVIGCMMWGRPTSRKIDSDAILELTRMCFIDETPPFVESQCLGMARKHIRKYYNKIKGLIAYSSTGAGHEGIIYKADNWYMLGGSKGGSWENRENRTNRDLSLKIRWTRSP
ncbi:XF1762 family protein [Caproiciproducens galactitolivorans]|uniref:XF1762 family protein n=1 Tax=Caproiciproducens galactitolivorans TaxID=642589 RepID=UPI0024099B37|nr:XF1762 family protein [Caproiciproducens galactitolivorans]